MHLFVLLPLEASQISVGFTSEGFPSCVAMPSGKAKSAYIYSSVCVCGGKAMPEYISSVA